MLKMYCQDCGSPTSYTSLKPKFCTSCGKPFDKTLVVNQIQLQKQTIIEKPRIKAKIQNNTEEDYNNDDETDDINYVPDISGIEVEISDTKPCKVKMSDIIGNRASSSKNTQEKRSKNTQEKPIKEPKKLKKNSPKEHKVKNPDFIKQFKSEASTLRSSVKNRKSTDG